ncbi:flagellar biosynthesis protein FlgA [Frankia sp. AgB1.9]|uniref:flagellar biosynthesis protein FlgA n=1 Tax=unclassified Frankia TaxID=2632575 RepID=UPI00193314BD|nr:MULTISPECIES: flagellar biosynthesis protein FlgA [unclassified Frankia]MBL7487442.1 flagellar biosynthesis protein FlgA [Frankia sp. AgW1.1]MBL7551040.1 flagellar biosynthesis protein FlgA [Frankia sp. AgB1.9]MBL7618821.1 flagellar biosynthesis protein FlgA [Frankia sp. AgB1.8]
MTFVAPRRWDAPEPDAEPLWEPTAGTRGPLRWGALATGLLLAVVGAFGAVWLGSNHQHLIDTVALARPLERGQVLTTGDLADVRVTTDGGRIRLVTPATARAVMVGRQALVDLPAGIVLNPELLGTVAGSAGTLTLGVAVDAAGLPSSGPRSGELVDVVGVDPVTKEPVTLAEQVTVTEVRAQNSAAGSGGMVVYLAVPDTVAAQVAMAAATSPGVRLLGVTGSAAAAVGAPSTDGSAGAGPDPAAGAGTSGPTVAGAPAAGGTGGGVADPSTQPVTPGANGTGVGVSGTAGPGATAGLGGTLGGGG